MGQQGYLQWWTTAPASRGPLLIGLPGQAGRQAGSRQAGRQAGNRQAGRQASKQAGRKAGRQAADRQAGRK